MSWTPTGIEPMEQEREREITVHCCSVLFCWCCSAGSKIGDRRKSSSGHTNNEASDAASLLRRGEDRSGHTSVLSDLVFFVIG